MKVIRTDAEGFQIHQGSEAWKQLRVGLLTGTGTALYAIWVRYGRA